VSYHDSTVCPLCAAEISELELLLALPQPSDGLFAWFTAAATPPLRRLPGWRAVTMVAAAALLIAGGVTSRLSSTVKRLPAHEQCHLVALASDGSLQPAGSWDASYDGNGQLTTTTDLDPDRLRSLTPFGDGGKQLVSLEFPR
jgi:hypothetical protein